MIELLIARLNSLYKMNDLLTEQVRAVAKVYHYNAGSLILLEGEVCNKACLVAKGLARSYYMNEGKDITSRFMDEGFIVTS